MLRRFVPFLVLSAILLSGVLAGAAPAGAQSQLDPFQTVSGPVQVITGDRISVGGRNIRLYGIDAPELQQTCENRHGRSYDCGATARDILKQIVGDREAQCTLYAKLSGNIFTGRCFIGTADIGEMLIRRGWAFAYRGTSHRYAVAEGQAQAAHAGLWAGRAQRPWVWRQEHPQPQQNTRR